MAGGYGAGSASNEKWNLNTVWAPTSVTRAETFVWYSAHPRLSLGLAYLWKQNAFRYLASANLLPETGRFPGINASAGVQGIGTGNPGYSLTFEKNSQDRRWNAYAGLGFRSNEDHVHPLFGFKHSPGGPWTVGMQLDGHDGHPFVTYGWQKQTFGLYLTRFKSPALMVGWRF